MSYLLAYLLYLLCEAPVASIEKMLLARAIHSTQAQQVNGSCSTTGRAVTRDDVSVIVSSTLHQETSVVSKCRLWTRYPISAFTISQSHLVFLSLCKRPTARSPAVPTFWSCLCDFWSFRTSVYNNCGARRKLSQCSTHAIVEGLTRKVIIMWCSQYLFPHIENQCTKAQ